MKRDCDLREGLYAAVVIPLCGDQDRLSHELPLAVGNVVGHVHLLGAVGNVDLKKMQKAKLKSLSLSVCRFIALFRLIDGPD